MTQYAIVENGLVSNIIELRDEDQGQFDFEALKIETGVECEIGWQVVDGKFVGPSPVVITPPVPQTLTMRQARLALLDAGMLDEVNSAIQSMPGADGLRAQIEWDFAGVVERASPIVGMMGQSLALNEEQLDNLFRSAAKL